MPQQETIIQADNLDKESILSVCLSGFRQLNWDVQAAGENQIMALTAKKWNTNSQLILVTASDGSLIVNSKMVKGEMVDALGKNKKNISAFTIAFETAKGSLQPAEDQNNKAVLADLRNKTIRLAAEEQAQAAEINKAMNLYGGNLYATYTIIALNVLVFLLMALNGGGIVEANGFVHLAWGSNYAPLTLSGDGWRLITCMFIHFGIFHLAFNMYAFYMVGFYLERMIGKTKFIAAYLCTGVLASMASLWWHTDPVNSAGASGAIFGMYGLFFAFLTTSIIPESIRKGLFKSIGIFIVYNLAFGTLGNIDNSAHIGGLISGFGFGYIYALDLKKQKLQQQPGIWITPLVILIITGSITFSFLQHHKGSAAERIQVLNEIKNAGYKDSEKFSAGFDQFLKIQDTAMSVWKTSPVTDSELNIKLKTFSLPQWNKAEALVKQMQSFNVSEQNHKKAGAMLQYVELRKQEVDIFTDFVADTSNIKRLKDVRTQMNKIVDTLKQQSDK